MIRQPSIRNFFCKLFPESTKPCKQETLIQCCLMLAQRRRRLANIKPAFAQRLVFTGNAKWNFVTLLLYLDFYIFF